jgi:hypothetical protein
MVKMWRCLVGFVVLAMALTCACSKQPGGACVRDAGIASTCGDDMTSGQCDMMNGDHWYKGKTCAQLGFGKAPTSRLVISEVFVQATLAGARPGWIEILNAGGEPLNLTGFTLLCGGDGGVSERVTLTGVVGGGGTFVVGGPRSVPGNGLPAYDQVADLSAARPSGGATALFAALFMPGEAPMSNCPISAVISGEPRADNPLGADCAAGVSRVGTASPGSSIERATWPADTWRVRSVPNPNRASCALGDAPHPPRVPR